MLSFHSGAELSLDRIRSVVIGAAPLACCEDPEGEIGVLVSVSAV